MQRLMKAHLDPKSGSKEPHSDDVLISEALVTMWGGIIDMANLLPYGTFKVAQDTELCERIYEEIRTVWQNINDPVPSYEVLRHLPYLVSNLLLLFINF